MRKFAVVILLATLLQVPSPANASIAVTSNLLISMDSLSASNFSGTTWSGQDGTTKNATMMTSGQYNSANRVVTMADLVSPNYASFGTGSSLGDALNPEGDLTVEVWVRIDNVHLSGWNILTSKYFTTPSGGSSGASWTYHFGLLFGKLNVYTTGAGGQNINGTTSVTSGWHQFAFTMINPTGSTYKGSSPDSSGTLKSYIDGALESTVTGSNVYQLPNLSNILQLGDGRTAGAGGLGIDGAMEKFRMYNKALTAAEINQNYRADAQNINHTMTAAPYNTILPTITGTQVNGTYETSTTGTWLNVPTSYAYQWLRAATVNGTYSNISGATSQTYQTVTADVGKFLKVTVAATNATGTFSETSTATSVITMAGTNLTFTMANQLPVYRTLNNLTASTGNVAGKVSFTINGKAIPGCKSKVVNSGNGYSATCPWKPSSHGAVNVVASFTSSDVGYTGTVGTITAAPGIARTTKR